MESTRTTGCSIDGPGGRLRGKMVTWLSARGPWKAGEEGQSKMAAPKHTASNKLRGIG
jgi:hypothetical protein